jgi:hypothetical protein
MNHYAVSYFNSFREAELCLMGPSYPTGRALGSSAGLCSSHQSDGSTNLKLVEKGVGVPI